MLSFKYFKNMLEAVETSPCKNFCDTNQWCRSGCVEEGVDKKGSCKFKGKETDCSCFTK